MEEAEALSNRIAIMVGGRLRCIGTNQHLKDKFGKGYSLEIRAPESANRGLQQWISDIFPGSKLKENLGNQLRYKVPMDQALSTAWANVETGKRDHGVTEYAISQTTLEQVFVRFASEQEEETGLDAASLAASIRQGIPNFVDMCLCRPEQEYEWDVDLKNGHPVLHVRVEFEHGAFVCCKDNPGIVTVDGVPVKALDEYGNETDKDLVLKQNTNPGCVDSSCCGCNSCCGCDDCFCCRNTRQVFRHSDHLFEIIDYSEIPGTNRARPCFLMVESKKGMVEANSSIPRGQYMATLFEQGGKSYCYMIGCPISLLLILCMAVKLWFAVVILLPFLIWFCTCCICGNWCGRSGHYRESPDVLFAELEPMTITTRVDGKSDKKRPTHSENTSLLKKTAVSQHSEKQSKNYTAPRDHDIL